MKKILSFSRDFTVILSFIILTQFNRCYSTRIIPVYEASSDVYEIHHNNLTYYVRNAIITDSVFSAERNLDEFVSRDAPKIYIHRDSLISLRSGFVSFSTTAITKIEQKTFETKKTKTLTTVLVATIGAGFTVGMVALLIQFFSDEVSGSTCGCFEDFCLDTGGCF